MVTTRDNLVRTAARLFRAHGVTGTGILTIVAEAGAPRGSLYHHFPGGKGQLVVEALRYEADRVTRDLGALLQAHPDEHAAVALFADALARSLETSDFRLGCPVSTAALELSADSPEVRQVCAETYAAWQALLRDHLVALGRSKADATHRAEVMLAAVEGGLILARAQRDGDVLRRIARALGPD